MADAVQAALTLLATVVDARLAATLKTLEAALRTELDARIEARLRAVTVPNSAPTGASQKVLAQLQEQVAMLMARARLETMSAPPQPKSSEELDQEATDQMENAPPLTYR